MDKISFTGFKNVSALTIESRPAGTNLYRLIANVSGDDTKALMKPLLKKYPYKFPAGYPQPKNKPFLQVDLFEYENMPEIGKDSFAINLNGHEIIPQTPDGYEALVKLKKIMRKIIEQKDENFGVTNNFKKHHELFSDYFMDLGFQKKDFMDFKVSESEVHSPQQVKNMAALLNDGFEGILKSLRKKFN